MGMRRRATWAPEFSKLDFSVRWPMGMVCDTQGSMGRAPDFSKLDFPSERLRWAEAACDTQGSIGRAPDFSKLDFPAGDRVRWAMGVRRATWATEFSKLDYPAERVRRPMDAGAACDAQGVIGRAPDFSKLDYPAVSGRLRDAIKVKSGLWALRLPWELLCTQDGMCAGCHVPNFSKLDFPT